MGVRLSAPCAAVEALAVPESMYPTPEAWYHDMLFNFRCAGFSLHEYYVLPHWELPIA